MYSPALKFYLLCLTVTEKVRPIICCCLLLTDVRGDIASENNIAVAAKKKSWIKESGVERTKTACATNKCACFAASSYYAATKFFTLAARLMNLISNKHRFRYQLRLNTRPTSSVCWPSGISLKKLRKSTLDSLFRALVAFEYENINCDLLSV